MTRIKLELPETFPFSTELTVRITDLNYGGHLGNADTLVLIHEARVRFLKSYGYSEIDIEGYGTIMLDAVIQFKAQAFASDVLIAEVAAADFSRLGCDIYYRLTNKETGVVVAVAKTGISVFDYENQKRISPPEAFVKKLGG
ncbi:MAG: thioesterase family protein [Kiritimatiellales bacterium]|nr:thioesterase family protein [Kiritimatiellota bacterium]MBL7011657.1 thioesterase family protein [Kiritimatiellales bacterium]